MKKLYVFILEFFDKRLTAFKSTEKLLVPKSVETLYPSINTTLNKKYMRQTDAISSVINSLLIVILLYINTDLKSVTFYSCQIQQSYGLNQKYYK